MLGTFDREKCLKNDRLCGHHYEGGSDLRYLGISDNGKWAIIKSGDVLRVVASNALFNVDANDFYRNNRDMENGGQNEIDNLG